LSVRFKEEEKVEREVRIRGGGNVVLGIVGPYRNVDLGRVR
jgi:hypothetical protein